MSTAYMEKELQRDDGLWFKHSRWHWSRYVADKRVDFWPSKSKFQVDGKVRQGDVYEAMRLLAEGRT